MNRSQTLVAVIIMIGVGAFFFRAMIGDKFDPQKRMANQEAAQQFIAKNEEMLVENQKKEGVVTTESGLQYEVLKSGDGRSPTMSDRVTVHYRGLLVDGTEFDSSYKRGKPASFPVNGLIPGWTEALQMMKEGDKWRVMIPARLAYGSQGAGNAIPPNATLEFEVELVKVD